MLAFFSRTDCLTIENLIRDHREAGKALLVDGHGELISSLATKRLYWASSRHRESIATITFHR